MKMTRTVFAIVAAGLLTLAASGGSQAAPIAPLSSAVTGDQSNVTPVYWYHHHHRYHHRWYRHHRHCWRGYYGRVHCRW
jgi:ABC-type glycerol-3-phosphate transport system substrate-binding protein